MRIGILTITPNIGFGGNLQAYALKSVLEKLGHDVSVIKFQSAYSLRQRISYFLHSLYKRIIRGELCKLTPEAEYRYRSKNIMPFHDKFLNFTKRVDNEADLHKLINSSFDVVVVGSDQVWRPKYVKGIENYFFKGINHSIRRISYAASFGVSEWEFDSLQTANCRELLKEFKYVSVREYSGIELIHQHLNYSGNVYQDLDPTLLADKGIYNRFSSEHHIEKYIFSYVLDSNGSKMSLLQKIEESTMLSSYRFNTNAENRNTPLKERIAPKIDEWISGIRNSEFVYTDSFHGCVFAIIFHKPFLVYVNSDRGAERFTSLLNFLGLSNRLVYDLNDVYDSLINENIDWEYVQKKIDDEKDLILNRLKKILN